MRDKLRRHTVEEIISNAGYEAIFKSVDETLGEDAKQKIEEKVIKLINEMTSYCLFRDGSLYGDKKSKGYLLLEQALEENKELVNSRVKENIEGISDEDFKYMIFDLLTDEIHRAIFGENKNG